MKGRRFLLAGLLGIAMTATAAPRAFAGDAEARERFATGVRLYDAKDYANALEAFRAAYREKASPGIQRNIALCLRALHRYPEAIDALEEMLARGGDAIDARTREGAKKAIDEMSASVATVRVALVLQGPEGTPRPPVLVRVDDVEVPTEKATTSMRLAAGEHTFRAQASGYGEAVQRVTLNGGERDHVVAIELVAVTAPALPGMVGVGADDGVTLVPAGEKPPPAPPPYVPDVPDAAPVIAPKVDRTWYGFAGLTIGSETRTMGPVLGEGPGGTARDFSGTSFTARVGRGVTRYFDVEGLAELGTISPSTTASNVSDVSVTTWVLAPAARFHTAGKLRFVSAFGLGLEGQSARGRVTPLASSGTTAPTTVTVTGSGVGGIGVFELGGQLVLGRLLAEMDGVLDWRGVGGATYAGQRLFLDSPATRVGLRLLIGYAF